MSATRRVLAASVVVVLAAGASAANAAAAATLAVPIGCVVASNSNPSPVPIVGSGFTPGSFVQLSTLTKSKPTPSLLTSVQADAAGNIRTLARAASFNSFKTYDEAFNLVAVQNGAQLAATTFRQVRFGVSLNLRSGASPRQKVRYTALGWMPGKGVYIHFRFRGQNKKTVKLGTASSPCGIVSRRMRALPLSRLSIGSYKFYVDQSPKYVRTTLPQARGSIRVFTVFR